MGTTDDYVRRCDDVIARGDASEANRLAEEIVSAFTPAIPRISSYRGSTPSGHGPHTVANLQALRGKLRVYRDQEEETTYGRFGVTALTENIHRLEDSLSSGLSQDEMKSTIDEIDRTYVDVVKGYVNGLSGWGLGPSELTQENCAAQVSMRVNKLKAYRDSEIRKQLVAAAQGTAVSVSQQVSNSNEVSIAITLSQTVERIDEVGSLSDEEKCALKGMLVEADQSTRKGKDETGKKVGKVLEWVSSNGVDVLIAVLPYLAQLVQHQL